MKTHKKLTRLCSLTFHFFEKSLLFFSEVHGVRIGDSAYYEMGLWLDIRCFCVLFPFVRIVVYWNRLLRGAVESMSLEVFKTSWGPFQPEQFYESISYIFSVLFTS